MKQVPVVGRLPDPYSPNAAIFTRQGITLYNSDIILLLNRVAVRYITYNTLTYEDDFNQV